MLLLFTFSLIVTLAKNSRPNSSSAPRSGTHSTTICTRTKHRKRSYSAILSREFSGEELGELLYISRHVALIPQDEGKARHSHIHPDSLRDGFAGPLPSVTRNRESKSKSKLRSLRQTKSSNSPRGKESQEPGTSANETLQVDKLPPIMGDSVQIINVKITSSQTPARECATTHNDTSDMNTVNSTQETSPTTVESTNLPQRIYPRIVSIGEARELDKPMAGVKSKRYPNSGKGRLSQGWSTPQPIGGLRGSPIYIPTTTITSKESSATKFGSVSKERRKVAEVDTRSSTPGMTININVNDFLGPENSISQEELN